MGSTLKLEPFNFGCQQMRPRFRKKIHLNAFPVCQGRLPVRWMAIESLNYSVYTTKSDV